jgi:hypothetical protein
MDPDPLFCYEDPDQPSKIIVGIRNSLQGTL